MEKTRLLFLCTGNSARSQMAEAFLRKYAGKFFEVHSAGLEPTGLKPLTIKVMEESGFDMSGQRSKSVAEFWEKVPFQILITVCDEADRNCPATPPGVDQRYHWSFEDPAAFIGTDDQKIAKFREVRDRIEARVKAWLDEQDLHEPG